VLLVEESNGVRCPLGVHFVHRVTARGKYIGSNYHSHIPFRLCAIPFAIFLQKTTARLSSPKSDHGQLTHTNGSRVRFRKIRQLSPESRPVAKGLTQCGGFYFRPIYFIEPLLYLLQVPWSGGAIIGNLFWTLEHWEFEFV
jgi:hypothetical protein